MISWWGGDPLKKEMEAHCSVFAWRIPWTEESGGLHRPRSCRVEHDWPAADIKRQRMPTLLSKATPQVISLLVY